MSHLKLLRSPTCFADSVELIQGYAQYQMQQEAKDKLLYFHNLNHVLGVQRRAELLFETVRPHWQAELNQLHDPLDLERLKALLRLAAIAHDLVQIFLPTTPWTSRRRETGISEAATIEKLLAAIQDLNTDLQHQHPYNPQLEISPTDCELLQEAIAATICQVDVCKQCLYQPYLYSDAEKSNLAIMLALADIGTLGMDGIVPFRQESREIFLEENPDFAPLVFHPEELDRHPPHFAEALRQKLLQHTRFQIRFAQNRLERLNFEIRDLPRQAHAVVRHEVFAHLHPDTITYLSDTTPTASDTPLETLLNFFNFDQDERAMPISQVSI